MLTEGTSIVPESTDVTRVRPLVGVLEPDVLLQGGLLDGGVVAEGTLEAHVAPGGVLAKPVRFHLVL